MSKSKPIQKPVSKKEVSEPKRNTLTREIFQNSNCVVLTDKQTQLFKNIRNNTLTIVHGPAGTSKAQPLTSPILTPNGWTTMGELNIGDKVISVDEIKDQVILDVRKEEEFVDGSIPGAINIELDQLRERHYELDINKEIVVLCQVGQRGHIASRLLSQLNYNVANLDGGYLTWLGSNSKG